MQTSQIEKRKPFITRGLSGLHNLGNTCYMNAALQCLFATDVLIGYFLRKEFKDDLRSGVTTILAQNIRKTKKIKEGEQIKIKSAKVRYFFKESLTYNFYKIVSIAWKLNCIVKPHAFKEIVGSKNRMFAGFHQNDSHEFLNFVLDMIHEETKTPAQLEIIDMPESVIEYMKIRDQYNTAISKLPDDKKLQVVEAYNKIRLNKLLEDAILKSCQTWKSYLEKNHSRIVDIFTGMFMSEVQCNECKNKTFTFDPYNMIQLELTKLFGTCTINECFDNYTKNELLTGQEKYQCTICNKKTEANKKICLWHVPDRLIIHLKRFSNNHQYTNKNNTFVDFPIKNLDISKNISSYITNINSVDKYDLYAVVNHSGSLSGGHYIAYTKNPISGEWFEFNDSDVVRIEEHEVKREIVSNGAYILFYKKQDKKTEDLDDNTSDDISISSSQLNNDEYEDIYH